MAAAFGRAAAAGKLPIKNHRAVTVVTGATCCEAAKAVAGQRKLLADAPRLPLAECTMSDQCKCRYQKHTDRREEEERRLLGTGESSIWNSANVNRRKKRGRRPSKS